MTAVCKVSRRDFLKLGLAGGAGLVLAFRLPGLPPALGAPAAAPFRPSAFVQVAPDGKVTVWVTRSEMGQGPRTVLPTIVADELEADFATIAIRQAPYDPKYGEQNTGGSTTVRTMWEPLRHAGAAAREMLVAAAAQRWRVEPAACRAERGAVLHPPSKRRLGYGALAAAAAKLPVPKHPRLKTPAELTLVGRSLPRLDVPEKVEGRAQFGIDVRLPGMLYASVARCPVFGGKLVHFDASKATAVPGVRHVVPIGRGVAVVADNSWAAMRGRDALGITWDEGPTATESSATLHRDFEKLLAKAGKRARNDGDVDAALGHAPRTLEATYALPFLAHATLEPQVCTARVTKDRCEVWTPTQSPARAHQTAAAVSGLPPDKVSVEVTLLGGGFGRKAFPDPVEEAVAVSKAIAKPVQVLYTRADDLQHCFYRPASLHRLRAALDRNGQPAAWHHRYSATPILSWLDPKTKTPELLELGGAADVPYEIPNVRVEFAAARSGVPRGWLRSVAHTYTAFVVESFIDELAHAARRDPYAYRRALLRTPRKIPYPGRPLALDTERLRGVLELAASKAGWGAPLPRGTGRGIASQFSFYSYAAEVAEVSVDRAGRVKVHRVVCAIDCGRVVNPEIIAEQMEGAVALALSYTLKHAITIEKGRVVQRNFDDYDLLHLDEMPTVEVHLVPSELPPTGIGEPGVPPVAPAVANAVFAACGKRVRRLPIRPEDLR